MSRQLSESRHLAAAILVGGLLWSAMCAAVDDWNVEGEHGELQVHGLLVEAPCLLDMSSEFQDVKMDGLALANLHHTGDTSQPVQLTFRLLGCYQARFLAKDMPLVSFMSPADPDEPTLLQISGVRGIGLRILDSQGRQVIPGKRHKPQFTSPGNNTLVYTVILVRTSAPLTTGRFEATVDFRMNYE